MLRFSPLVAVLTLLLSIALSVSSAEPTNDTAAKPAIQPRSALIYPADDALLRKTHSTRFSFDFAETKLKDVLDYFARTTELPIVLDQRAFDEGALPTDVSITCAGKDRPFGVALEEILEPLGATWAIRSGTVLVTTQQAAEDVVRYGAIGVYEVVDFQGDLETLIELITGTIAPTTWADVGGSGSIKAFESDGICVLVIAQTREVHEEVEALLTAIRSQHSDKVGVRQRAKSMLAKVDGSSAVVEELPPFAEDARTRAIVAGNNRFALQMYAQLAKDPKRENLFFSPYSIAAAMGMLARGAGGATEMEITKTFGWDMPREDVARGFQTLLAAMPHDDRHGFELLVANGLFGQQGYPFEPSYLTALHQQFGADLIDVNFGRPGQAADTINAWVSEHTRGRISKAISPNALSPEQRLVVGNCVYFRGYWVNPFDRIRTKPNHFYGLKSKVTAKFMHQQQKFRYGEVADVQVIELPYLGDAISMIVLLPPKDKLANLERSLVEGGLEPFVDSLRKREVMLSLPRFKLDDGMSLVEILHALGIRDLFVDRADLSGISAEKPLFVNFVQHQAIVEVDEIGTVAAAVTTGGAAGFGSMVPDRPQEFTADRPFVFVIRDERTGSILFLGRLAQPAEEAVP